MKSHVMPNKQKKFDTNSKPLSGVTWEETPCLEWLYMHISRYLFWKTELFFYQNPTLFSLFLSFTMYFEVPFLWTDFLLKSHFRQFNSKLWVSEWVVSELRVLTGARLKKNKKKHHINELSIPLASQLETTATGRFRTSCMVNAIDRQNINISFLLITCILSLALICITYHLATTQGQG